MKEPQVNLDILLDAPVATVWQAWTDPAVLLRWFGSDPAGKGINAGLDVRPGGRFSVTFRDSDETEHTCFGVYSRVLAEQELAFSWEWVSEPGVESQVTLSFKPEVGGTRMHFEHTGIGDASEHDYLYGWRETFAKLEAILRND